MGGFDVEVEVVFDFELVGKFVKVGFGGCVVVVEDGGLGEGFVYFFGDWGVGEKYEFFDEGYGVEMDFGFDVDGVWGFGFYLYFDFWGGEG